MIIAINSMAYISDGPLIRFYPFGFCLRIKYHALVRCFTTRKSLCAVSVYVCRHNVVPIFYLITSRAESLAKFKPNIK